MNYLANTSISKLIRLIKTEIKRISENINIASGTVTRDKLAQDALYSPLLVMSAETVYLSATHIGRTISASWNQSLNIEIQQEDSINIPLGAEIAVFMWGTAAEIKVVPNGTRIVIPGDGTLYSSGSFKISEPYGMIALKKVSHNETVGDAWLITGNVEVVT